MTRILTVKAFIKEVQSKNQYEKIGCIDFGMKRIGLATTDETKQYAFPMGSIVVRQPPKTEESLSDLNRQMQEFSMKQNVRYFVVGFPLMPGTRALTPLCHDIFFTINGLPRTGEPLTFCMWDESFSTSDARKIIKATSIRKSVTIKQKDAVAATVILKSFLHAFNSF